MNSPGKDCLADNEKRKTNNADGRVAAIILTEAWLGAKEAPFPKCEAEPTRASDLRLALDGSSRSA